MLTMIKSFKQVFLRVFFAGEDYCLFTSIRFVIVHHSIFKVEHTLTNILFLTFFAGEEINKSFIYIYIYIYIYGERKRDKDR